MPTSQREGAKVAWCGGVLEELPRNPSQHHCCLHLAPGRALECCSVSSLLIPGPTSTRALSLLPSPGELDWAALKDS